MLLPALAALAFQAWYNHARFGSALSFADWSMYRGNSRPGLQRAVDPLRLVSGAFAYFGFDRGNLSPQAPWLVLRSVRSSNPLLPYLPNARAAVVISSISDWMLKGTSNARILHEVRTLAPTAQIVVSADSVAGAEQLYAQGADYVLISPVLAAEHLYQILGDLTPAAIQQARTHQHRKLLGRLAHT